MSSDSCSTTHLRAHATDAIFVRDRSLVDDLVGRMNFTEMILFATTGEAPSRVQVRVLDAVLVTPVEHGLMPSAIAAQMVYSSSTALTWHASPTSSAASGSAGC